MPPRSVVTAATRGGGGQAAEVDIATAIGGIELREHLISTFAGEIVINCPTTFRHVVAH
jgi:hypothetical protein